MKQTTEIKARFKCYCSTCHFTIWQGEKMLYNGNAWHMDCKEALKDNTPRVMHPKFEALIGSVSKSKLRNLLNNSNP